MNTRTCGFVGSWKVERQFPFIAGFNFYTVFQPGCQGRKKCASDPHAFSVRLACRRDRTEFKPVQNLEAARADGPEFLSEFGILFPAAFLAKCVVCDPPDLFIDGLVQFQSLGNR